MSQVNDLYQRIILDHGKNPRHFVANSDATHRATGNNPVCGDKIELFLEVVGPRIRAASFIGHSCAVCTASASLMTEKLVGMTVDEAIDLNAKFDRLMKEEQLDESLGDVAALCGVRRFPVRVKCATLPWQTFRSALEGNAEATTES